MNSTDDAVGVSDEEVPFIPGVLLSTSVEEGAGEIGTEDVIDTGGARLVARYQ